MTGGAPGLSSCVANVRPMAADAPSMENMLAEKHSSLRRSGAPVPVNTNDDIV